MLREDTGDMSPTTGFRSRTSLHAADSPPQPDQATTSVLDDIFGEPTAAPTTSSQLDDVFGCSPPRNEGLISRNGGDDQDDGTAIAAAVANNRDVSDIPRLRSVHVTAGYRDGLAESKAGHVQDGFDEGFPLGAVLGMKVGWALGVLEGVAVALRAAAVRKSGSEAEKDAVGAFESVRTQLVEARKELDMASLFGQDYFDAEGVWKYQIDGPEDDVSFEVVAAQHPLVSKWLAAVDALVEKTGIDLGILDRRAREDPDDETTTVG